MMRARMPPRAFDDRDVTLLGQPEQLATLGSVLSSRTRLAVLNALMASGEPLHINEIARRVGVDASPVRTHLELLAKAGIATEVSLELGRERRFETRLSDVRLTLEGVNRSAAPEKQAAPTKQVQKLSKRLGALENEMARLREEARRVKADLAKAWAEALEAEDDATAKAKRRRA